MIDILEKKRPEILAPCGTPECFEAALAAGADAVYLAGENYGARAYAGNFDNNALLSALERAHFFGVKVYLTVNTLTKESEIEGVLDYLKPLYEAGLDAVIVQDLGVIDMIRKNLPSLPVHASTQVNVTGRAGTEFMYRLGAERVVLNREITLNELRDIKKNVPVELEVFVHGAMCFSYSGRCLMSSFAGGRSGNRGRCAQPCRKIFKAPDSSKKSKGAYMMSMKDMCTLRYVPELIDMGIDSFKIEGRMKNAEYVAAAVSSYRKVVDAYLEDRLTEKMIDEEERKLSELFCRGGFTDGYLGMENRTPKEITAHGLIASGRQGHSGITIGTVKSVKNGRIYIKLVEKLSPEDELAVITEKKEMMLTSNVSAAAGSVAELKCPDTRLVTPGTKVLRLRSSVLHRSLQELIQGGPDRKRIEIHFSLKQGEASILTFKTEDGISVSVEGPEGQLAVKAPVSSEDIEKRLLKLGDTPFTAEGAFIENDYNSFIPLGALGELKRRAAEELYSKIVSSYKRRDDKSIKSANDNTVKSASDNCEKYSYIDRGNAAERNLIISIADSEQLGTVLNQVKQLDNELNQVGDYKDITILIDTGYGNFNNASQTELTDLMSEIRKQGYNTGLILPFISNEAYTERFISYAASFAENERVMIGIRNIDDFSLVIESEDVKNIKDKTILLKSSLYAYNHYAEDFFERTVHEAFDNAEVILEAPSELNRHELSDLSVPEKVTRTTLIYGKTAVMLTAALTASEKIYEVKDDKFYSFLIKSAGELCYNVILNKAPVCLFRYIKDSSFDQSVIEFSTENADEIREVLGEMSISLREGDRDYKPSFDFTYGHYQRGIE